MSAPGHQAWEYRIVTGIGQPELEELGRQGWELVGIGTGDGGATLYFKRPALSFREQVTIDQKRRYYVEWGRPIPEDGGGADR